MEREENTSNRSEENAAPEPRPAARRPLVVSLDRSTTSTATVFRIVAVILLLLFVGGILASTLSALKYVLFLLVVSTFFAYLIDPLVKLLRRPFKTRSLERFMPRPLAIILAYAIVFTVLAVSISNIAPLVAEQGREFGSNIPAYATSMRQNFNELNRRFDRLSIPEDLQTRINEQAVAVGERITGAFGNLLLGFAGYLPWFVIVPILGFFLLKDVNLIRLAVLRIFPAGPYRFRAEAVMQDVNSTLAAYIRAQLISCVLIGTLCTVGFYVIGLKYSLLLGILAGVFEFVPLLGPASIAVIVTLTALLSDDPWNAVYVVIFLVVLRVVHDYVTYPRIVRDGLHLHPVLIILSVLAGEQVAGIPGVFLAIPLVAIAVVVYRHIVEHKGSKGLVADMFDSNPKTSEESQT